MEIDEINDETFDIILNSPKIKYFNSEDLKEYARIIREFQIRIVKVKLKWYNKNIINKFTKRNSNTRRIKTIIWG